MKLETPLVLDAVTFAVCGKLPPEEYAHGMELWLSCRLPLEITLKETGISSVIAPTVTLRMPR